MHRVKRSLTRNTVTRAAVVLCAAMVAMLHNAQFICAQVTRTQSNWRILLGVVLENVLSTWINIRSIPRGCIRSLEKMWYPATHSVCMHIGVRLNGVDPARHAFSRACIQKRLCGMEFVHSVVHSRADSGFDWLHWPRYVATGAQESMHAVLARQPAEVVHIARHEDVCAQQEKCCTKPTHKTREDPSKPPSTPHSQLHNAMRLLEQNPRCLAGLWSSQLRCVKTDHTNSIRTCQSCSQGGQPLGHGNSSSVNLNTHNLLNQVIETTYVSPFGTC
jgi:hypothetical protein